MQTEFYAAILTADLEPKPFVRQALRLLVIDFRETALHALGDCVHVRVTDPDLFPALAALNPPSWGT